MASVDISFGLAGIKDGETGGAPVYLGNPQLTENVTSSGSSAATTGSATKGGVVRVTSDGPIYITVGPSPTASATTGWALAAGGVIDIAVREGYKVAVIDKA